MSALTFKMKQRPDQRVDLSCLTPDRLAGMRSKDIEALHIGTTRSKLCVGDLFKVSGDETSQIRFVGTDDRCDHIGARFGEGEVLVDGDAGAYLGASLKGGTLTLKGDAGPYAGAAMSGGTLDIGGNAGERAGGVLVGEVHGMRGGRLIIRGNAGPMLAERMRRGIITVCGDADDYAGARVVAGTIVFLGKVGRFAGYGSKRGTLIFKKEPKEILPTFADCGVIEFTYLKLLERHLKEHDVKLRLPRRAQRLMGDMAAMGKGEMLILR
ncbi:Formyltransferase/hydrolase complex Fhc subunit C [Methyloligella halotolerans]|uniref:Formyltransferase/hydrolase complex Fhc subunit C n=1 Tax=Methyloligella halotolerans TaxID=1177755 RepID=A0A1E2S305_9HYPH|nr:formylmethanofuran dehydrogenase subunit C [Methyloligella halotolerans]ODA68780.1 Formyltransferase/hydrolase complex Fhc subunit C [Methyloligella halotolerans]